MMNIELDEFPDGAVCLTCGEGMEGDLIFAEGAMRGDPTLDKQREILEYIMAAVEAYQGRCK